MSFEQNQFIERGYYIARGLLDPKEVCDVLCGLLRTIRDQLRCCEIVDTPIDLFEALKLLHQIDIIRYKKVIGSLWRRVDAERLMHHPNIIAFLESFFGFRDIFAPGGSILFVMSEELRIRDGYFGLNPHQDFPSVQGSLDGMVVWVPLVDVGKDNFTMEVIPGSHRLGLVRNVNHTRNGWEIASECREDAFLPVEAVVGDVVFMSVFTIHRSSSRGLPNRLRLALSTRFDNGSEPTFIDRCYPTAYVRTVHRDQYFEDFPKAEQIDLLWSKK